MYNEYMTGLGPVRISDSEACTLKIADTIRLSRRGRYGLPKQSISAIEEIALKRALTIEAACIKFARFKYDRAA